MREFIPELIKILGLFGVLLSYILKSDTISRRFTWIKYYSSMLEVVFIIGVCLLFFLVLFDSFIARLIRKYFFKNVDINLLYNGKTGMLYDTKTGNRNISFRDRTVREMLLKISQQDQHELGNVIGKEFWREYVANQAKVEPLITFRDKIRRCFGYGTQKILAKRWSRYDSTSGMGKFDTKELSQDLTGILKVINPFTTTEETIKFMEGYIEGVLCAMTSKDLEVKFHCYEPGNVDS